MAERENFSATPEISALSTPQMFAQRSKDQSLSIVESFEITGGIPKILRLPTPSDRDQTIPRKCLYQGE